MLVFQTHFAIKSWLYGLTNVFFFFRLNAGKTIQPGRTFASNNKKPSAIRLLIVFSRSIYTNRQEASKKCKSKRYLIALNKWHTSLGNREPYNLTHGLKVTAKNNFYVHVCKKKPEPWVWKKYFCSSSQKCRIKVSNIQHISDCLGRCQLLQQPRCLMVTWWVKRKTNTTTCAWL